MDTSKPVLLIVMPWAPILEPNLGTSVLKSVFRQSGIQCDVYYASMPLLNFITYNTFHWLSELWGLNDFVFTGELEPGLDAERHALIERSLRDRQGVLALQQNDFVEVERHVNKLLKIRNEVVPSFFDFIMEDIDFEKYAFVGFTCLIDQTIASLALASRIKKHYPDILLAFGGYALQPPAGPSLQKAFPDLMDVVCYGDGEAVVLPLYEAATQQRSFEDVPNISFFKQGTELHSSQSQLKINLNESPAPDFDDYFLQRIEMKERFQIDLGVASIPMESSRGCWWGEKSHCIFCGIDDDTMRYRRKDDVVIESQMDELNRRYGVRNFRFSDYIMPRQLLNGMLPKLASRGRPYVMHYETKANMSEQDIQTCAQGGIRLFQPGIESFSTPVLKLMKKGVRAAQNLACIFNMARNGIHVYYNIIWGFPGETIDHYEQLVELIPAISHFPPPSSVVPVLVTRFAPLHASPERFGCNTEMVSHWRYDCLFSKSYLKSRNLNHQDWAYYFESPYREFSDEMLSVYDVLQHQCMRWTHRYQEDRAKLTFRCHEDGIYLEDSRFRDQAESYSFGPCHAAVAQEMIGRPTRREKVINEVFQHGFSESEVSLAIDDFLANRIVVHESGDLAWLAFCESDKIGNVQKFPAHSAVAEGVDETRLTSPSQWGEWSRQTVMPIGMARLP